MGLREYVYACDFHLGCSISIQWFKWVIDGNKILYSSGEETDLRRKVMRGWTSREGSQFTVGLVDATTKGKMKEHRRNLSITKFN